VVVERRARIDAILVVEHVVNVQHDLLCLGPAGHALKIVTRVADRKLLRADLAKRGGPAGLGDYDLSPGIFQPDLAVRGAERIEACFRGDPVRLVVDVRVRPVPCRIDVDADEIDERDELLRARVGEPEIRPRVSSSFKMVRVMRLSIAATHNLERNGF
jgi:hypothetical protein